MKTTLIFTIELERELDTEEIDELHSTLVAQCEDVGFIIGTDDIKVEETYKSQAIETK